MGPPSVGSTRNAAATGNPPTGIPLAPRVRRLGRVDYTACWQQMRAFTDSRTRETPDELWLCEHEPVYTLGQAGRREHLLDTSGIPVVESDRGGQVTWHGPGQLIVYVLIDLKRAEIGIRSLVERLEQSVIDLLLETPQHILANGRRDAPGVYVDGAKIAALGLRVRRGCTYHGLALNVDADLDAFNGIDPCGYRGLQVTRTRDLGIEASMATLGDALIDHIAQRLVAAPATS